PKTVIFICTPPEPILDIHCPRRVLVVAERREGYPNGLLDKGKPVVRRGRKAMGLNRSEGGTDKAARLPKGWTGPVSKSGTQAAKAAWVFLCALHHSTSRLSKSINCRNRPRLLRSNLNCNRGTARKGAPFASAGSA